MSTKKYNILVIGSKNHKNTSKCIEWGDDLEYVGDYDALIIDTTTLTEEKLKSIIQDDSGYFNKLKKDIKDVQEKRGILITCIISPYVFNEEPHGSSAKDFLLKSTNNYSWSPVIPIFEAIPKGKKIDSKNSVLPEEYVNKIDGFNLLYNGCVNNTNYIDKSDDGRRILDIGVRYLLFKRRKEGFK